MILRDGEVHLDADADPADDPLLALRAGAARGRARDRRSIATRSSGSPSARPRSPIRGRRARASCSSGCCSPAPHAIPVIEALDHRGVWARILPEWEPVRSRPQRNAYHRFTVDRHLLETVGQRRGRRPTASTGPTSW